VNDDEPTVINVLGFLAAFAGIVALAVFIA
jgi:hypothetical protein